MIRRFFVSCSALVALMVVSGCGLSRTSQVNILLSPVNLPANSDIFVDRISNNFNLEKNKQGGVGDEGSQRVTNFLQNKSVVVVIIPVPDQVCFASEDRMLTYKRNLYRADIVSKYGKQSAKIEEIRKYIYRNAASYGLVASEKVRCDSP